MKKYGILFTIICFSCVNRVGDKPPDYTCKIIAVGKGAGSVEVADFNHDGFPDLAVANAEDSSISILLGDGHGEFKAAPGSPVFAGRYPNDIAIMDIDQDGNLDLGIANTEARFLTLLLGNGKGQFEQAPASPVPVHSKPHTHGIAIADFNGDGHPDLATDSWGVNNVVIMYNDGKTRFGQETFYVVGKRPYQRLRAADLNQDGKPDIVTTNLDGNNATVLLGQGNGKFDEAPGSPFPCGDAPFGVAIGDINGDGWPDLAIVNSPTITSENKGIDGLWVLVGDGKGGFSTLKGSPFRSGKSPSRVAIGDLNGDGINDIAVTNYNGESISVYYMSKKGVAATETIKVGRRPDGIAIHDMNGDGKNDIIVSNNNDNNIMIFFRN